MSWTQHPARFRNRSATQPVDWGFRLARRIHPHDSPQFSNVYGRCSELQARTLVLRRHKPIRGGGGFHKMHIVGIPVMLGNSLPELIVAAHSRTKDQLPSVHTSEPSA